MDAPADARDWVGLSAEPLPVAAALEWATLGSCGAVVTFSGTVREFADGRRGVTELVYEAYAEHAEPRMRDVCAGARVRWPAVERIALLHRVGALALRETAVVVVVSSPHRPEAFEAAKWCIDSLKSSVPIWKKETWEGGSDWGTRAQPVDTARSSS